MEPRINFTGFVVRPGKESTIVADFDNDSFETIHLTQVALGGKPVKGPHTIFIKNEDGEFAVGTLDREKCAQFSLDITIADDTIRVFQTGGSDIYLTGYRTEAPVMYDDDEDGIMMGDDDSMDEGDSEEEEEDGEEESSDDEEAPQGVPLKGPKFRALVNDEAEEESGSEGEEDSEEEEEDEESSEEEGTSEEEEEEEAPAKKRKAVLQTPQPAKKAKEDIGKAAPATAPAKVGALPVTPSSDVEYIAALKKFLQNNGPAKPAVLGGAVKRAAKAPKLKKIVEQNKDIFTYNPTTDMVSLA